MEPSKKALGIEAFLENLTGRTTAIMQQTCVRKPIGCGEPATEFRNALSKREFQISGLCQKCQDEVFGDD